MQHPEVREAAVFGVPDEKSGEAIAAVVVTLGDSALSAEAVSDHVRAHLAAYKAPSLVFLRSEALPRNAAGKLLKGELKESYRAK